MVFGQQQRKLTTSSENTKRQNTLVLFLFPPKKKKNGARKRVEGCEIESESFVQKEKIQLKYKSSEDEK